MNIDPTCYIAKTAVIIGDVTLGKHCGVYPNAVIRGDQNTITIEDGSNIQDCCVIHVNSDNPVHIGKDVSIGHQAMVHGGTIEDTCLIGINATILNGAHIGTGSIIGANALVTSGMEVPPHSLVLGVPGKIVKQDKTYVKSIQENADTYKRLTREHIQGKHHWYPHK